MAIKICPECGGKVFAGRQDCPHCGYLFPREGEKKLCPGCEETIVPNPDGTCPVCGYAFESAPAPDSEGLFGGEQSDVPTAPLPGDIDRYFEYETLSDGSYKINGCKDAYVTKLSLPEGTKVIGAHALAGLTYLRSVTFPATLEIVEEGAFEGDARLDVLLPEGIVVGEGALEGTLAEEKLYKIQKEKEARINSILSELESRGRDVDASFREAAKIWQRLENDARGYEVKELSPLHQSSLETMEAIRARFDSFHEEISDCFPSFDVVKAEAIFADAEKVKAEAEALLRAVKENEAKVKDAIEAAKKAVEKKKQELEALTNHFNEIKASIANMQSLMQKADDVARPMAVLDEKFAGDRSFIGIVAEARKEIDALLASQPSIEEEFQKLAASSDVEKMSSVVKEEEELLAKVTQVFEPADAAWRSKKITIEFGVWESKPIQWRVLFVDPLRAHVISEDILKQMPLYKNRRAIKGVATNDYVYDSDVLAWLAKFSKSAFKQEVLPADRLELVPHEELQRYEYGFFDDDSRIAKYKGETSAWWISRLHEVYHTRWPAFVSPDGLCGDCVWDGHIFDDAGVRPVMSIYLSL